MSRSSSTSLSDPLVNVDRAIKMIQKRTVNISYFKRLHEGSLLWLNAVRLTHENIQQYYEAGELAARAQQLGRPRAAAAASTTTRCASQ